MCVSVCVCACVSVNPDRADHAPCPAVVLIPMLSACN